MAKRWIAVAALLAMYVAVNLYVVVFVTIIHHVLFTLTVTDEVGKPIANAVVRSVWHSEWDQRDHDQRQLGVADRLGVVRGNIVVQEQPDWAFPQMGRFRTPALFFEVSAPGRRVQRVRAFQLCPNVKYRRPVCVGSIAVRPAA